MKQLIFDFNNMFSHNIGSKHGVTAADLAGMSDDLKKAHRHIKSILSSDANRVKLGLEWARLPYQDKKTIEDIQSFGDEIAETYENVISLGIGGSFLGLKAAQDALCAPYYNEFPSVRKGRPRIYFDGNNLDPVTLGTILGNLNPAKTFVVVISKSGETTETKAAFTVVEDWLKNGVGSQFCHAKLAPTSVNSALGSKFCHAKLAPTSVNSALGRKFGHQIFAITDPKSGSLRKRVNLEQSKDALSFRNLSVMNGVGGRFSELNIGLLHLAIIGVRIQDVLDGAKAMAGRCSSEDLYSNPALMYAAAQTVLYNKKGKSVAVMMPFCETLKSTAEWYVQLLAESLGKKYARKIVKSADGSETWLNSPKVLNKGRTPIPSRGTGDLHSIQQNNIEGANDKTVTFMKVEKFSGDIKIPGGCDILSDRSYSKLLLLAEEATEWALVRESRPNCAITLPEISPYHWGELIFFFEMATAYEGELAGVNAFDQPGVEGYKNYLYYKLDKPGMAKEISDAIKKSPLLKDKKYIL